MIKVSSILFADTGHMVARFPPSSRLAKAVLRPVFRRVRSLPVYTELRKQRAEPRKVAFLPAYGREGAALLRIYDMAEALKPFGWGSLILPPWMSLGQRQRALMAFQPDIVVMQGARHALNRPGFYPAWPVVFDMDDADFHLDHLETPVRHAMGQVAAVITGSEYIADWCRAAGAPRAHVIWTGSPVSERPRPPAAARAPIIAWAQTRPMTYTGEAAFVARVMAAVAKKCPGLTLRLYDRRKTDSPAFLSQFQNPGLSVQWQNKMGYADYLTSFEDVALGLAPLSMAAPFARGKSFGKVLAYLDSHVPVIASDAGEHGRFFTAQSGVISNEPEVWANAITSLMRDPDKRQAMAQAGFEAFQARLSLKAAARATDQVLRDVSAMSDCGALFDVAV